jgi:hypothetical protein
MCIIHIRPATRCADTPMRHVDVHDETCTTNELRDIGGSKEILITMMHGGHVQTGRIQ